MESERGKRQSGSDFLTRDPKRRRYEDTWAGGSDNWHGNDSSSRTVRSTAPSPEEKILGAEAEGSPCVSLLLPPHTSLPHLLSAQALLCPGDTCLHGVRTVEGGNQVCKSLPSAAHTPEGGLQLNFSCTARAATYCRVLASLRIFALPLPLPPPSPPPALLTLSTVGERRTGIPQTLIREQVLLCSLAMSCTSRQSVEKGKVSAPLRMGLCVGGRETVTRTVVPLQLLEEPFLGAQDMRLHLVEGMLLVGERRLARTEDAAPSKFLEEVFAKLQKLLRQHGQEQPYTRAVLLCATWAEVAILVDWVRLSQLQDTFASHFHSIGVVHGCEAGVGEAYRQVTGWKAAGQGLGLQEEALALHTVALHSLARGRGIGEILQRDTIVVEKAFSERLPGPSGGMLCALAVQWVEVRGKAEMTQIGATISSLGGLEQGETFLSTVLPPAAAKDPAMFQGLGLFR